MIPLRPAGSRLDEPLSAHGAYVLKRPGETPYEAVRRGLRMYFPRESFIIPEEGDHISEEGTEYNVPGHQFKIIVPHKWNGW